MILKMYAIYTTIIVFIYLLFFLTIIGCNIEKINICIIRYQKIFKISPNDVETFMN